MPFSPIAPPSAWRSIVKAVTYRLVVMCADATAIYLFTGKWTIALGFMLASNVYTTALYFLHERVWARIRWGRAGAVAPAYPLAGPPAGLGPSAGTSRYRPARPSKANTTP